MFTFEERYFLWIPILTYAYLYYLYNVYVAMKELVYICLYYYWSIKV